MNDEEHRIYSQLDNNFPCNIRENIANEIQMSNVCYDYRPHSSKDKANLMKSKVFVENLSNYEIVGEIPLDMGLSLSDPSTGVRVEVPHAPCDRVQGGCRGHRRGGE